MLSDGDLLYIPRGWWHVAMPLDEPTLHLTVGVNNPTGADLLSWFADRLRCDEQVRCDLPMFATDEARHEAAQRMMESIASAWKPQIISQYLDEADARVRPRARFSLPWSATEDVLPPDNVDFALRWTGVRPVRIEKDETAGEISIASHGQKWRFAAKAEPVLLILISQRPVAVSELERACAAAVDRTTLRAFLRELVDSGLIAIQSGRDA
jgi:ribosomal protein L16 Arg81 hydroxylase